MVLASHVSNDAFLHIPQPLPKNPTIIFHITGNPGLISFYHLFLSLLSSDPSPRNPTCVQDGIQGAAESQCRRSSQCIIAGFSLGGFEVPGGEGALSDQMRELSRPAGGPQGPVFSLQDQTILTLRRVTRLTTELRSEFPKLFSSGPPNVILTGHSVGAYIALEVISLCHKSRLHPSASTGGEVVFETPFVISAAILLTPTIVDIAKSDSGRIAAQVLTHFPCFPQLMQALASGLAAILPATWLRRLISGATGMEPGSAAGEATARFLTSSGAVKQSLCMARDEMREIRSDRWGAEVWGSSAKSDLTAPKLVLYFAHSDHWVANTTREEIVKAISSLQGENGGEEEMCRSTAVVAEEGECVHGWCIQQSEAVAKRVGRWVEDILKIEQRHKL